MSTTPDHWKVELSSDNIDPRRQASCTPGKTMTTPDNTGVVWLVEPPRQDLTWLYERYRVGYIFPVASRTSPGIMYEDVIRWARLAFNPKTDKFVLTGNVTKVSLAALAIRASYPKNRIKLLAYDFDRQKYKEVNCDG